MLSGMGKVADPPIAAHAREEVAERLKKYRAHLGKSQAGFAADILSIERDRYAKYEQGLHEMPYFLLRRLSERSGHSIHWWITGHEWAATKGREPALKVVQR